MNVEFWQKSISNTHMSSIRKKGKLSDTIKIYTSNEKICCHAIHTCRIIVKKVLFLTQKNSSSND